MTHTHSALPTDVTQGGFVVPTAGMTRAMTHLPPRGVRFGCGALLGIAVGIVRAPARGSNTLRKIARIARRGRDRAEAIIENAAICAHDPRARIAHTAEHAKAASARGKESTSRR